MHPETMAIHAGRLPDPATGAVTPPIHLSTTFERAPDGEYPQGLMYSRNANPTRKALEECLAALEGGFDAAAFASGSAAIMSVFQCLRPGDHALAPLEAYTGTTKLLRELFAPWGLRVSTVDLGDLAAVEAALEPTTKLVWIETPSNPRLGITDIAAVSALAHRVGALTACDNTFATPLGQQPLALGADLVMHATTKYLGGHSDVLGGALIAREPSPLWEKLRALQIMGGAVPSPFECWLVLRGIQSLPARIHGHTRNATALAEFLSGHPAVERVFYPGLPAHPGHAIAAAQMLQFGGMLSFQVRGGRDAAIQVAARVKLWTRATSLGGPESLIEHRASIEGEGTRTPDNLLRLSVGLEHADDLIADLAQALGAGSGNRGAE